jgi:hypothetical protein
MSADLEQAAVRVRKARRRSVCALCRGPVLVGQQIGSDGGDWSHVQCFIADRKERVNTETMQYSYGEVGHDPPVHVVEGAWQGPKETTRDAAVNTSLCGSRLARRIKEEPRRNVLCRDCEDLMNQAALSPNAPVAPISTEPVTVSTEEPPSLMCDYKQLIVPLGKMFVDRSHAQQRKEQSGWVKDIADSFSWTIFNLNPVALSARADGHFHVIDGQHRTAGARLAGHGPETPIHANVWHNLTFEQEAALFILLNAKRHSVKPLDLFKAQVTAGYEDAVALDILLNTYDWKVGSAGAEGNFAAVTTLRKVYNKPSGPETCEKIIATITKAWGHRSEGAHQTIIKVLAAFYGKYPQAGVDRLAHVMQKTMTPVDIQKWAHEVAWQAASVSRLQHCYDSGLRKAPKLGSAEDLI